MRATRLYSILFALCFAAASVGCGDDSSNGDPSENNGPSSEELMERLDEFVDTCAEWHVECVGADGVEPEAFEGPCEDDFHRHVAEAVQPEGCIDARLDEWECLRDPCPLETDELICVEVSAEVTNTCRPQEMDFDPPPGSDTPTVEESDFVAACSNYLDVCDPDNMSTEQDCENMWILDLANAANPGSCVDLRTEGWDCMAAEDCGEGNACMSVLMDLGPHCMY